MMDANVKAFGPTTWLGSLLYNKADGSGLLYMRNRYYDPQTGQFTQQDPIGIADGLNLYGFANGDPVNFSDPFGLCKKGKRCRRFTLGHLASIDVMKGDVVTGGSQVALSGNTGHSTGPHLHYEVGDVDEDGVYTADLTGGPGSDGCPLASCANVSSRPAGNRCVEVNGQTRCRAHNGTDIAVPRGTRVFAPQGGEVIRAGYQDPGHPSVGFGLRVTIDVEIPDHEHQ